MARPGRLRPRWIVGLVIAVVVAAACVRLGFWQLERLDQRGAYNDSVETAIEAPPAAVETLIPQGAPVDRVDAAYRRAVAVGHYDPQGESVLFGRALDGAPGNHVLTPLRLKDGRAVIVDRGWVPLEMDTPPVAAAAPPSGEVEVTGFLLPAESSGVQATTSGPATKVNLDEIAAENPGLELVPLYVRLQAQTPQNPGELPRPAPLEPLGEGPHLGYAVQWFVFAVIALIGIVLLIRRDLRDERASTRAKPLPS